jgi:hypothetical protein
VVQWFAMLIYLKFPAAAAAISVVPGLASGEKAIAGRPVHVPRASNLVPSSGR